MNNSSASFYDRFSIFYPLVGLFLQPQKRRLYREINSLPAGQLLEVGVGNGKDLKYYRNHQVTGIDTSPGMLEQAKRNSRADLQLMNAEALDFPDNSFDYIVLSHVIAVVDDPEQLLKEVHRVLRSGGTFLLLNHFTPDNWLRHLDNSAEVLARKFHFRSVFPLRNLKYLQQFSLVRQVSFQPLSYFQLLIYQKP